MCVTLCSTVVENFYHTSLNTPGHPYLVSQRHSSVQHQVHNADSHLLCHLQMSNVGMYDDALIVN